MSLSVSYSSVGIRSPSGTHLCQLHNTFESLYWPAGALETDLFKCISTDSSYKEGFILNIMVYKNTLQRSFLSNSRWQACYIQLSESVLLVFTIQLLYCIIISDIYKFIIFNLLYKWFVYKMLYIDIFLKILKI